jgi:hypothetical protein
MKEHSETRRDYHFEDVGFFFGRWWFLAERCATLWAIKVEIIHF